MPKIPINRNLQHSVWINESHTIISIEYSAFSGCNSLTKIKLPASLTRIETFAFQGCRSLREIAVDGKNSTYASKDGILYDKSKKELFCCPEGRKGDIVIPASVTTIRSSAFSDCSSLTGIKLPKGLIDIGRYAFSGCSGLKEVKLPTGLTHIADDAFYGCGSLTEITVDKKNPAYMSQGGILYDKNQKTLICCPGGKKGNIVIPASVTSIEDFAFDNCKNLILLVYNGKNKKPSVTVKNSKGKVLKNKRDYTVTYPKAMKNVGSYTVTIKLKGNYKGTVKKTFQIIPKGAQISKVMPKKKGFSLKWKKQAVQTKGYEIAYSTNKKFTKKTTKTAVIGKNKTVSRTVSKLKAEKKYYIRIRTYKTIKLNGKSKKLYSAWSKVKTVITKK